eukprot:scaffold1850_cov194-Pinguiococcus_pyrenoidosus.AAC.67
MDEEHMPVLRSSISHVPCSPSSSPISPLSVVADLWRLVCKYRSGEAVASCVASRKESAERGKEVLYTGIRYRNRCDKDMNMNMKDMANKGSSNDRPFRWIGSRGSDAKYGMLQHRHCARSATSTPLDPCRIVASLRPISPDRRVAPSKADLSVDVHRDE